MMLSAVVRRSTVHLIQKRICNIDSFAFFRFPILYNAEVIYFVNECAKRPVLYKPFVLAVFYKNSVVDNLIACAVYREFLSFFYIEDFTQVNPERLLIVVVFFGLIAVMFHSYSSFLYIILYMYLLVNGFLAYIYLL